MEPLEDRKGRAYLEALYRRNLRPKAVGCSGRALADVRPATATDMGGATRSPGCTKTVCAVALGGTKVVCTVQLSLSEETRTTSCGANASSKETAKAGDASAEAQAPISNSSSSADSGLQPDQITVHVEELTHGGSGPGANRPSVSASPNMNAHFVLAAKLHQVLNSRRCFGCQEVRDLLYVAGTGASETTNSPTTSGCPGKSKNVITDGRWSLLLDIAVVAHDGNLLDACFLAAVKTLMRVEVPGLQWSDGSFAIDPELPRRALGSRVDTVPLHVTSLIAPLKVEAPEGVEQDDTDSASESEAAPKRRKTDSDGLKLELVAVADPSNVEENQRTWTPIDALQGGIRGVSPTTVSVVHMLNCAKTRKFFARDSDASDDVKPLQTDGSFNLAVKGYLPLDAAGSALLNRLCHRKLAPGCHQWARFLVDDQQEV